MRKIIENQGEARKSGRLKSKNLSKRDRERERGEKQQNAQSQQLRNKAKQTNKNMFSE